MTTDCMFTVMNCTTQAHFKSLLKDFEITCIFLKHSSVLFSDFLSFAFKNIYSLLWDLINSLNVTT